MLLVCATEMLRYQAGLIFLCSFEFITTQLCKVCVFLYSAVYLAELRLVENEKKKDRTFGNVLAAGLAVYFHEESKLKI